MVSAMSSITAHFRSPDRFHPAARRAGADNRPADHAVRFFVENQQFGLATAPQSEAIARQKPPTEGGVS